ncbi:GNAT family N-acetyltransferase [Shimazuella sp. AN120528]|uniref:GNAT family N-acetyltransferase n=1 Tax=Shimazuella soli TaxID=1892854 RepID=UPI001F102412|nr:GNAT family protein [Shimazuella soli]MCH5585589.1 GNAT family N-acetyltransferase [Shimazuella soli]
MLQTNGLYIRPLSAKDVDFLYNYWQENRAFLEPFNPIRPESYYTLEGQLEKIKTEITDWENDRSYGFGIFLYDHQLIGRITLSNIVRASWQNSTIGYSMAENMQGKGYMTLAIKLALQFAFEEIGLHRVQAGVMPRNKGSIRVLEKNGFLYEGLSKYHVKINGVWEDHKIFAITTETWNHIKNK